MQKQSQNIVHFLQNRECGFRLNLSKSLNIQKIAEQKAACSEMEEIHCKLPSSVRSTFLMSFSPDCSKVASTHGDHKIYVCDVKTGKLLHKLEGHPRTPWCVIFHPTSNDILASGCLGGEVRVWDLHGGSEQWRADQNTVITSLTFHPFDKVLVIATFDMIHFWNWKYQKPFATCCTSSVREKVRFVKFNRLGTKLITGITQPDTISDNSNDERSQRQPTEVFVDTAARRSLWSRLMHMYQNIENSEEEEALERARHYAESLTHSSFLQRHLSNTWTPPVIPTNTTTTPLISQSSGNSGGSSSSNSSAPSNSTPSSSASSSSTPSSSTSSSSTSGNSTRNSGSNISELREISESHEEFLVRAFWRTFNRLRTICSALERRMHQLQRNSEPQNADTPTSPPSSSSFESGNDNNQNDTSSNATGSGNATSEQLVNILTRLQNSLQFSAIAESVPPEQIQQLQWRISEILERLTNVTGYRARLTTLRDHIFEVAERSEHRMEGSSPISRQDLGHCLFLVEMSLQLTRQMQRILQADYRLIRLSLSNPSSSSQAAASSSGGQDSPPSAPRSNPTSLSSLCVLCGNRGFTSRSNEESQPNRSRGTRRSVEFREIRQRLSLQRSLTQRQTLPEMITNLRAELLHSTSSNSSASTTRHSVPHFRSFLVGSSSNSTSNGNQYVSSSDSSDSSGDENSVPSNPFRTSPATSNFSVNFSQPRIISRDSNRLYFHNSPFNNNETSQAGTRTDSENDAYNLPRETQYSDIPNGQMGSTSISSNQNMPPAASETRNDPRQARVHSDSENRYNLLDENIYVTNPNGQTEPVSLSNRQSTNRINNETRNNIVRLARRTFYIRNMHIDTSPPNGDQEPIPPQERPRSPPLPTILSGGSDFSIWQYEPLFSNWHPYFAQAFYEASRRSQFGGSHDNNTSYVHRIQCWDFSKYVIPDITNAKANIVVSKCKIHNDASVSISQDGEVLAALVPAHVNELVTFAIYSLKPEMLGVCLYKSPYDGNAISVSLSPFSHYVVVGITPPRFTTFNLSDKEPVAHIYKLKVINEKEWSGFNVRSLSQQSALGNQVSLNSVQWLPQSGQGLIYGTNKGCLCICKPIAPMPPNKLRTFKLFRPDSSNYRRRRHNISGVQPMSSASTQTVEPTTQTTGTQTFVTNGNSVP